MMREPTLEAAAIQGQLEFDLDFDFPEERTQQTAAAAMTQPSIAPAERAPTESFTTVGSNNISSSTVRWIDECDVNDNDAIINHPRRPNMPGQKSWLDLRGPRRIIQDPEAQSLLIDFQKTRRLHANVFFSPKLLYRVSKGAAGEGYHCRQATLEEIRKNVNAKRSKQQPSSSNGGGSSSKPNSGTSVVKDAVPKPTKATATTTSRNKIVVDAVQPPQPQPTVSKGPKAITPTAEKNGKTSSSKTSPDVTKKITLRRTILEFYTLLDELDQVPKLASEAQDFRKTMDAFLSLPYTDVYPETPVAQQGYHVIHDAVQILWEGLCKLYVEGVEEYTAVPRSTSYKEVPSLYRKSLGLGTSSGEEDQDEGVDADGKSFCTPKVSSSSRKTHMESSSTDDSSDLETDEEELEDSLMEEWSSDEEEEFEGEEYEGALEASATTGTTGSPRVPGRRRRRRRSGGSTGTKSPKSRRSKKRRAKMRNADCEKPDSMDMGSGHQTRSPDTVSSSPGGTPMSFSSTRDKKNLIKAAKTAASRMSCPPYAPPFVHEEAAAVAVTTTETAPNTSSKPVKVKRKSDPGTKKKHEEAADTASPPKTSPGLLKRKSTKKRDDPEPEAEHTIPSAYRAAFEKLREKRLANELVKPVAGTRESRLFKSDWKNPLMINKMMQPSDDDDAAGEAPLKPSGRRAQLKPTVNLTGGSEHSAIKLKSKLLNDKLTGGSEHSSVMSSVSKFPYRQW